MQLIEVHNTNILIINFLKYVGIITSIVAYVCIDVLFLLQLNTNGFAIFGGADTDTVRFTPIPYRHMAGSAVLIPYTVDLTTGIGGDTFVSYR